MSLQGFLEAAHVVENGRPLVPAFGKVRRQMHDAVERLVGLGQIGIVQGGHADGHQRIDVLVARFHPDLPNLVLRSPSRRCRSQQPSVGRTACRGAGPSGRRWRPKPTSRPSKATTVTIQRRMAGLSAMGCRCQGEFRGPCLDALSGAMLGPLFAAASRHDAHFRLFFSRLHLGPMRPSAPRPRRRVRRSKPITIPRPVPKGSRLAATRRASARPGRSVCSSVCREPMASKASAAPASRSVCCRAALPANCRRDRPAADPRHQSRRLRLAAARLRKATSTSTATSSIIAVRPRPIPATSGCETPSVPPNGPKRHARRRWRSGRLWRRPRCPALQAAVTSGQYVDPRGVFYGGQQPCWSNRTLRQILAQHGAWVSHAAFIDLHSGLGPYGVGEIMNNHAPGHGGYQRIAEWFGGEATSGETGNSSSAPVSGDTTVAFDETLPRAAVSGITLEYGTVPLKDMIDALRADNWLHVHGRLDSSRGQGHQGPASAKPSIPTGKTGRPWSGNVPPTSPDAWRRASRCPEA